MEIMLNCMRVIAYLLIGITGARILGYGLLEILIWPIAIPVTLIIKGGLSILEDKRVCDTCKYHDDFTWTCFNGDAPNKAEFMAPDDSCDEWEGTNDSTESE